MDIWLWFMHVQLTQRIRFQRLKQFQNHIIPPWHQNDTVSYFFFSCEPGYPRQGLLRYPLLLPRLWDLSHNKLASHSITTWQDSILSFVFTIIILALLFKHIFKLTFKYVQSSPFSKSSLLESTIEVSHDLLKTSMFKTISNPYACAEWIYLSRTRACMIWMYLMQLAMYVCIHNLTNHKRVEACSYHSLSALTQLGHIFQEIQAYYIHISITYQQHITLGNYTSN